MTHDAEAQLSHDLTPASDTWTAADAAPAMASRLVAEGIGTMVLVVAGLSAALFAMPGNLNATVVPAAGFGIAVLVLIIAIGHVSGAHLNPAVTVGLWAAGRFPGRDIAPYTLAQVAGAVAGGAVVRGLVEIVPGSEGGRAAMNALSIGWGEHSAWGVGLVGALAVEVIVTGALVATVLAATSVKAPPGQAPFTIAIALTMLVIIAIPLTNAGLNPARATGTALFADTWALAQLWAWWVAPTLGGLLVGLAYRAFGPAEDLEPAGS